MILQFWSFYSIVDIQFDDAAIIALARQIVWDILAINALK